MDPDSLELSGFRVYEGLGFRGGFFFSFLM